MQIQKVEVVRRKNVNLEPERHCLEHVLYCHYKREAGELAEAVGKSEEYRAGIIFSLLMLDVPETENARCSGS